MKNGSTEWNLRGKYNDNKGEKKNDSYWLQINYVGIREVQNNKHLSIKKARSCIST